MLIADFYCSEKFLLTFFPFFGGWWWVGDWYNGPAADTETEPDEEWVKNRKDESRAFQEWDEDADIDESGK